MPNAHLLSTASPEAAALLGWARGTAAPGTAGPVAFAVVARRADVGRARDLLGPESITFCGEAGDEGDALQLEGDPGRVGEELVAGPDLFVQVEAYAGAAFLPIVGPTLLRLAGADDVAALRDDLDATARGSVPPVLGDPQLQLADRCALGGRPCGGPRHRLHIDADGAVRTTPCGPVLGGPDATIDALDDAWRALGCERACAPAGVADAVADARGTRPWWPRVLAVLDLLHAARQDDPGDWTAAGFGDVG
ncbi:daptide biosynthesis RiPP recognition protein [Patulibacter sp. NPDC049589]|uniref:daptide biosynthesis RiPP recognition protein n=1 Tax=Patulibacter sp. NPDC049589 TaxID=3154731 RepID=UPI0034392098